MGNALMKKIVALLVLVAIVFGAYRWWRGRPVPLVDNVGGASSTSAGGDDVALPAPRKELFTAPRAAIQPAQSVVVSEACKQLWNGLRALDMSQKDRRLPSPAGCEKLPGNLGTWHEAYQRACANPTSTECEIALYDYRAAITEELTKDTPLNQINDSKVLTDKMLARLRAPQMNAAAVADVAERLLETEPNMPQAARAAVSMRIQSAASEAIGKPDDPRWKQVDEALEKASRTQEGNSRTLMEAKLISDHLRYPDPERAGQEAESLSRQHPNLGVGPFHQAWSAFDKGDRKRAEELLIEAARREPRYGQALNELRSGSEHPFHPPLPSFQFSPQ